MSHHTIAGDFTEYTCFMKTVIASTSRSHLAKQGCSPTKELDMVHALKQQSSYGTGSSRDTIHVSGRGGICYI